MSQVLKDVNDLDTDARAEEEKKLRLQHFCHLRLASPAESETSLGGGPREADWEEWMGRKG